MDFKLFNLSTIYYRSEGGPPKPLSDLQLKLFFFTIFFRAVLLREILLA